MPLVLWSITNELRSAYLLGRALERGVPAANALREARVFGPRRSRVERAARRWTPAQIEAALARAARIDRLSKGLGRGAPWDDLRELGLALTAQAAPSVRRSAV